MQISAEKTHTLGGDVAEQFWTLPNAITVSRIALTPFLFALPWFSGPDWSACMGVAFLAVSLTDLVDGYIARVHNQESRIGKLLDPLADKLLVMTALVMLVGVGRIPGWGLPLVVAILAREIMVTGLRGIAGSQGVVIVASSLGKWESGFRLAAVRALHNHLQF